LSHVRCWLARVSLLVLCAFGTSAAFAAVFSADAVKAAFLFRFASYVEWPAGTASGEPFVIAVAGAEDVAKHLDGILPRVTVRGRLAVVRRATRVDDLDGAHILYVGPDALSRTRVLRRAALEKPILIVTDDVDGIDAGGVINFIQADRNVRFEISLVAADRARLKIDSALLSVAARVERRPQAASEVKGVQ
jgi:hypothetical protein